MPTYLTPENDVVAYDEDDKAIVENKASSKIINFRKIKTVAFDDPLSKTLEFGNWSDFYKFETTEEAILESDYTLSYLMYKFQKKHKIAPKFLNISSDVIKDTFYDKFFDRMNIPLSSLDFNHSFDNKTTDLDRFFVIINDMILFYDGHSSYLIYPHTYLEDKESPLYVLLGIIKKYKTPKVNKNKIYIVYRTQHGFQKRSFDVKKRNINIKENYNDDFLSVNDDIIEKLNDYKKTGLVILHGEPGTGKTSYIRYLAGKLKRNIIFISPDMVHHITSPEFIPFLLENSNSILIIEDAEPAIQKRNGDGRSGAVSNILNMTDGLLSDCLNISVVATFNTARKDIDDALLRKGRLLKAYKFDKLESDKSFNLLTKLGKTIRDTRVKEALTLAEIYFYGDDNKSEDFEHRTAGFGK